VDRAGVSIIRVDSEEKFERVGGSCIGGGTYWGLCRLLLPSVRSFEDAMDMCIKGDFNKVDMLVKYDTAPAKHSIDAAL
jgi:pantothenate kinase